MRVISLQMLWSASGALALDGLLSARTLSKTEQVLAQADFGDHVEGTQLKHEFEADKVKLMEKLKEAGALDMMTKSSVAAEHAKFEKDVAKAKEKGKENLRHMTNDKALSMLSAKMSTEQREKMSVVLQKAGASATAVMSEDDKQMFVEAMKSLNDMFLSVDDERIRTLTDCTVDLFAMYRQMYFYWDTIRELEASTGEAISQAYLAWTNKLSVQLKIHSEKEKLEQLKSEQEIEMGKEDKILEGMEADVTLYKFIMTQINKQCMKEDGNFLLQTDKTHKQEQCESQISVNKALLKVFSNPETVSKAEQDLDAHANHSLKQTLQNIHNAEREEIHAKYSFLQKNKKAASEAASQEEQPWNVGDGAGGVCGHAELDCSALYTIVGQELECNKQKVREQEGAIKALEEKQKEDREQINKQITVYEKTEEQFTSQIMNYLNEAKGYFAPKWKNFWMLIDYFHRTKDRRFQCYLKLFELESNYYCATKHLREYMKDLTLEAFGLGEDDITDCAAGEFMHPEAYCYYPTNPDQHVPCVEGELLPTDPDQLPQQQWMRDQITPSIQSEKAWKALNNETIALACPNTMTLTQTCNNFLCPLDCSVSEWGEWTACTAECDGGSQQKTRQVVRTQRNGGNKCPPTQEDRSCNTQACDVDCLLHEDWVEDTGCLQACTSYPGEKRYEMLKKHIKVEAVGQGECPDKHADGERILEDSTNCPARQCRGDEVCGDVMDLVIVYECSSTVTRLGCWFMASFVVQMLERMPTVAWTFPTMKVGLVKFGNGISKTADGGKSYFVNPAVEMSALTSNVQGLTGKMYSDVIGLWTGSSKYHLGFNNIGSAMKKAGEVLDRSPRTNGDVEAVKKILLITKGKRAGCTVVKSVAEELKESGVVIDMVLFSSTYESNPGEYEVLQESVTYPFKAHLHPVGPLYKLNDYGFRQQIAQSLIPHVCPDAFSPRVMYRRMCRQKYAIVHRGRTCHNWTKQLSSRPLSLRKCRDRANERGYKGFVHTSIDDEAGGTEPNCFTHAEDGKKEQVDASGKPAEGTCNYVPDFGKGQEKKYKGWTNQDLAAGSGKVTSHYRVLESSAECGAGMRRRDYLASKADEQTLKMAGGNGR